MLLFTIQFLTPSLTMRTHTHSTKEEKGSLELRSKNKFSMGDLPQVTHSQAPDSVLHAPKHAQGLALLNQLLQPPHS